MRHLNDHTTTEDGLRLRTQTWLPAGEPRAVLAFAHGQSDHSGRYGHVGEALAGAGFALHMADLRGHGESPGRRGHVMRFEEYRLDFDALVQSAWDIAPTAPYFIGGHSMGGLIALNAALDRPIGPRGVVVTGPLLRLAFEPPGWLVAVGRAAAVIAPTMAFSNQLDAQDLCHDPAVVREYEGDPLVHSQVSARAYTEMTRAETGTLAQAGRLEMPLLLLQGGADRVVSPQASREFYERAGSADKTLRVYDGLYHEILNEPENGQVLADLIEWLAQRA